MSRIYKKDQNVAETRRVYAQRTNSHDVIDDHHLNVDWQHESSTVFASSSDKLDMLENIYTFIDQEEVRGFIENNPDIISTLFDLPAIIKDYFNQSSLALEVFVDHEEPDFIELALIIQVKCDPIEAAKKHIAMNRDARFRELNRPANKLCITVDPS